MSFDWRCGRRLDGDAGHWITGRSAGKSFGHPLALDVGVKELFRAWGAELHCFPFVPLTDSPSTRHSTGRRPRCCSCSCRTLEVKARGVISSLPCRLRTDLPARFGWEWRVVRNWRRVVRVRPRPA